MNMIKSTLTILLLLLTCGLHAQPLTRSQVELLTHDSIEVYTATTDRKIAQVLDGFVRKQTILSDSMSLADSMAIARGYFVRLPDSNILTAGGWTSFAYLLNNYFSRTQSDARYLQSFTEVDPVWITDSFRFAHRGDTTPGRNYPYSSNPRGYISTIDSTNFVKYPDTLIKIETKADANGRFQPIGNYINNIVGNYYNHIWADVNSNYIFENRFRTVETNAANNTVFGGVDSIGNTQISGLGNTWIGAGVAKNQAGDTDDTYVGLGAGAHASGIDNGYFADQSGKNAIGRNNLFAGAQSGYNYIGSGSICIGSFAGWNASCEGCIYIDNGWDSTNNVYDVFISKVPYMFANMNKKFTQWNTSFNIRYNDTVGGQIYNHPRVASNSNDSVLVYDVATNSFRTSAPKLGLTDTTLPGYGETQTGKSRNIDTGTVLVQGTQTLPGGMIAGTRNNQPVSLSANNGGVVLSITTNGRYTYSTTGISAGSGVRWGIYNNDNNGVNMTAGTMIGQFAGNGMANGTSTSTMWAMRPFYWGNGITLNSSFRFYITGSDALFWDALNLNPGFTQSRRRMVIEYNYWGTGDNATSVNGSPQYKLLIDNAGDSVQIAGIGIKRTINQTGNFITGLQYDNTTLWSIDTFGNFNAPKFKVTSGTSAQFQKGDGSLDGTTYLSGTVNLTTQVSNILPIVNGGTNISGYTTGDMLYASATNVLSKLTVGSSAQILVVNSSVPSWQTMSGNATIGNTGVLTIGASQVTNGMLNGGIDLTTKVTGVLPIANGGTGISTIAEQTITDGATVTLNGSSGINFKVTLGGNRTLAFSNTVAGQVYILKVIQDGTGSRTLTLPAGCKVVNGGGGLVTLTTTAAATDVLCLYYDGTNYWVTVGLNYN